MKRIGLTLVAVFCLAVTTFAAENQPTTTRWEGNINVNKLGKYFSILGYVLSWAMVYAYTSGIESNIHQIRDMLIASLIVVILPNKIFNKI